MKVIGHLKRTALVPTYHPHERLVHGQMANPTAPMVAVRRGPEKMRDGLPDEYVALWVPTGSFDWLMEVP